MLIIPSLSIAIVTVTSAKLIHDGTNPLKQTGESCNEHLRISKILKAWEQRGNDWAEVSDVFLPLTAPLLMPKAVAWPAGHGVCRTPVPVGGCYWDSWQAIETWLQKAYPNIHLAGHTGRKRTSPALKI